MAKKNDAPPAAVAAAAKNRPTVSEDRLQAARELVRQLRDKNLSIGEAEENLKRLVEEASELRHRTLPDFFTEIGIRNLGLEAEGNYPAFDATLKPYYKANIAASWPEEKRDAAFDWLEKHDRGDVVRRTFVIEVDRRDAKKIDKVRKLLEKAGLEYSERRDVPWTSLTATVREMYEKKDVVLSPDDLATLGAVVGQIVEVKPLKEKK